MRSKCFFRTLTVGVWNIQGLYEKINGVKLSKLDEDIFKGTLRKHDIFCLQETHMASQENIASSLNKDFYIKTLGRSKSGNNRYFGGLLLFIRKSIKDGVQISERFDDDAVEITLQKKFFGLQDDINYCLCMLAP